MSANDSAITTKPRSSYARSAQPAVPMYSHTHNNEVERGTLTSPSALNSTHSRLDAYLHNQVKPLSRTGRNLAATSPRHTHTVAAQYKHRYADTTSAAVVDRPKTSNNNKENKSTPQHAMYLEEEQIYHAINRTPLPPILRQPSSNTTAPSAALSASKSHTQPRQPSRPPSASRQLSSTAVAKQHSDAALLSSMTSRLLQLEQLCASQQRTIQQLQAAHNDHTLQAQNDELQRKLDDVLQFLRDYDLEWVGEHDNDIVDNSRGARTDTATPPSLWFDVKQLQQCVADLNNTAQHTLHSSSNIATFKLPPTLKVTVYQNGLYIGGGPLRAYELPECVTFIRDILDGYTPSELKREYTHGVVIELSDKSTETLVGSQRNNTFKAFRGRGNVLSRRQSMRPSLTIGNNTTLFNIASTHVGGTSATAETSSAVRHVIDRTISSMTAQQLLAKLPASTVTNGNIHNIRSSVAALIQPTTASAPPAKPATPSKRAHSAHQRTNTHLQCKFDNGHATETLTLSHNNTVGQLRARITEMLTGATNNGDADVRFELRTLYPAKVHRDDTATMEKAGLTPNATVLVRTIT